MGVEKNVDASSSPEDGLVTSVASDGNLDVLSTPESVEDGIDSTSTKVVEVTSAKKITIKVTMIFPSNSDMFDIIYIYINIYIYMRNTYGTNTLLDNKFLLGEV